MKLAPILKRLQIEPDTWMNQVNHFGKRYFKVAGSKDRFIASCKNGIHHIPVNKLIKSIALKISRKWMNGQGKASPFESPT